MTYCENSNKGIKNDEWREHRLSEEHLERTGKNFCGTCKMVFFNSIDSGDGQILYERGKDHTISHVHKQNMRRLGYSF